MKLTKTMLDKYRCYMVIKGWALISILRNCKVAHPGCW